MDDTYAGHSAEVKQQIVAMAMHASGMRETARVRHGSPTTVIKELKKGPELPPVHQSVLAVLCPQPVEGERWRADALEVRRGLERRVAE